jgi:5'-deoxynucleotidase YfbR-like HD superfamily hydrolase
LPLDTQLAVLFHDAADAFVGDVVKPLKIMLPEYAAIEDRVEAVIAEKFGIDFRRYREQVREIDHAMLIAERKEMFSHDDVEWFGERDVRPLNIDFAIWGPGRAEYVFIHEAEWIGVSDA